MLSEGNASLFLNLVPDSSSLETNRKAFLGGCQEALSYWKEGDRRRVWFF